MNTTILLIAILTASFNSSSDWEDSIAGVKLSVGSIAEVDGNDVIAFISSVLILE